MIIISASLECAARKQMQNKISFFNFIFHIDDDLYIHFTELVFKHTKKTSFFLSLGEQVKTIKIMLKLFNIIVSLCIYRKM